MLLALGGAACIFARAEPDLSLERVRTAGRLAIAIDPSYPPFADYDAAGAVAGYDVDLAAAVCRDLGVAPDLRAIDVGSAVDALLARKVDAVISALPPYPEYTRDVTYSEPYFNAGQVLVSAANRPITDSAALRGRTLAVEQGSTAEDAARKLAGVEVRVVDTPEAALALVGAGAEAAMLDRVLAAGLTHGRTDLVAGPPQTFEPYVIAVRRADAALAGAVDASLRRQRAEGTLDALERKWLGGG
jgi:polar amino acid transport system substrate-binding protein